MDKVEIMLIKSLVIDEINNQQGTVNKIKALAKMGNQDIHIDEDNLPQFETKDYYFTDFGLVSKSAVLPHQIMTEEQKKNVKNTAKKIGLGVAAVTAATAVGTVIKKIFKKKIGG